MNYMVVHEELKAGGWRTIVPDLPRCGATGMKIETRKRSAERNIKKYVAMLFKRELELPVDTSKIVRLKRSVLRCVIHFVEITPPSGSKFVGGQG